MINKRIVLIGHIGHGKTTLFGKICNKQIKTYYGGKSSTRQSFLSKSSYGLGFEILDTPGLGSYEDRIAHVVGIYSALIEGPVHQIVVVIKYERIELMRGLLRQMIQRQFNRFRDIITVAVTFWDMSIDEQSKLEDQKLILQLLKKFNVSRATFISKDDSAESICQTFDQILIKSIDEDDIYLNQSGVSQSQMLEHEQRKKRQITLAELESYFDLVDIDDELLDKLNVAQGHIMTIFRKKGKVTKNFIEKFPIENKLMPEVMHKLCLKIEEMGNETIYEFQLKQVQLFNEIQASLKEENFGYYLESQLKKAITQDIRDLKYIAQEKMSKSKSHFLNFIKKCPNCGLIWMKVYGCNGSTTCGRVPENENPEFIQSKQPQMFDIKINENQVYFQEFQPNQAVTENYHKISSYYQGKIGCGQTLVWSELPPLDENYLRELLDPDVLSYITKQELEENIQSELKNQVNEVMKAQKVIYL